MEWQVRGLPPLLLHADSGEGLSEQDRSLTSKEQYDGY